MNKGMGILFSCSNELLLQDERFAPKIEKQLISDVASAIEDSILACMAAGIPENLIGVEMPCNVRRKHSDPYKVEANIFFTGKLN